MPHPYSGSPPSREWQNNEFRPKIEYRAVHELRPLGRIARRHPQKQIEKIAASIRQFGFLNPLLVDDTGAVICGLARLAAAQYLLMTTLPVIVASHLSPVEKRTYVLAENRLAEEADWARDILSEELRDLQTLDRDFDLEIAGWDTIELENLTRVITDRDLDEIPAPPLTPVSLSGDHWELGDQQTLCGDALNPADVALLMGAGKAKAGFLDAPYNVPIVGHVTKNAAHREFQMAAGEMSETRFTEFLTKAHRNVADHLVDGGLIYSCMDWRHADNMLDARRAAGLDLINICVWTKPQAGQGSFYRSQHELVFVFKNGKAQHLNRIQLGRHGRSRSNVWSYQGVSGLVRESRVDHASHPTPKPLAMVEDVCLDCTEKGDLLVDVFGGGGTSLMAAERTGRRARLMEIDPGYVDVIVERWQSYTGRQATLVGTGMTFAEVRAQRANMRSQSPVPLDSMDEQPPPTVRIRTRTVTSKSGGE